MTAKRKPKRADNAQKKRRILNPPIRMDKHAKSLIKSVRIVKKAAE